MSVEEAEAYYKDPKLGDFRRSLKRGWTSPAKEKPSVQEKGKYYKIKILKENRLITQIKIKGGKL